MIKQLTSKTNIVAVVAVVLYVMQAFGLIDTIPEDFALGAGLAAVLNIIIKIMKSIYYKYVVKNV